MIKIIEFIILIIYNNALKNINKAKNVLNKVILQIIFKILV
jgi:hypothetical protein